MARRANTQCYYREHTCQGETWTCRRCKEPFCSETHWHINDAGQKNVVCTQCEHEEKKERQPQETKPVDLPACITVKHDEPSGTALITDTDTGQSVTVQRDHMPSIRLLLAAFYDETARARWLYERIASTDTGLDGCGLVVTDNDLLAETLAPAGVEPDQIADDYGTTLY